MSSTLTLTPHLPPPVLRRPGVLAGPSPEARTHGLGIRWSQPFTGRLNSLLAPSITSFEERWTRISEQTEALLGHEADDLRQAGLILRRQLRTQSCTEEMLEQCFALVCAASGRELQLSPHREQVYAGWLMYHGLIAEMQTGEGKTLTAAFPAIAAALTGVPVHIITANDYLVERDAAFLRPLFNTLGLSVGTVTADSTDAERRGVYGADVTYLTGQQLVFDYLKDRQKLPNEPWSLRARLYDVMTPEGTSKLQRGLCFAIVDEADSVLIDEARTPLVLSKPSAEHLNHAEFAVALGVSRRLEDNEDYLVDHQQIELTEAGIDHLASLTSSLPVRWKNTRYREEMARQGLTALHLLKQNQHYIVREDKIVLLDENTGRAMPDRTLSHGLHQMLQVKEGCAVTAPNETIARISYQRFFSKYIQLCGMTGTAHEARRELISVYGLGVKRIPTHSTCSRTDDGTKLFSNMREKYTHLIQRVSTIVEAGRPVLIGTRSVSESEQVARVLEQAELPCRVLNASQDQQEADIVASAGQPGSIVVATNLAGRGTDISLHDDVKAAGGLHVISTQLNDSARIDRQLSGRCARQGDPGSHELLLSLEDEIFRTMVPMPIRTRLADLANPDNRLWRCLTQVLTTIVQRSRSAQLKLQRRAVRRADDHMQDLLTFGEQE